jgi:hypothetical protein
MTDSKKEILFSVTKDEFDVEAYVGTGKGGQHRNRTHSCIRITHKASGVVANACESRHQHENKETAFKRLANSPKFRSWLKVRASEVLGRPTIGEIVDNLMSAANIKVEVRGEDGKWQKQTTAECTPTTSASLPMQNPVKQLT